MTLKVTSMQKALGAYVVFLDGSLDGNNYPIFEEELNQIIDTSPTLIALDLRHLDYISSAGIRVILKTIKELKKGDGKMVFMKLQPQIKKVFDIMNAIPSMKIFSSVQELDEYLDIIQKKVLKRKI
jgi:anti-anti-sigma factor